ncbi:MAG TPA: hypothetical protein IAC62_03810, partial [Candidatus Pelethocola excrementipullorum]|nr:hypothetical protein [Candidatus Pelethocola excrementipullorum]
MNVRKAFKSIVAWMLVITMLLTTNLSAWAVDITQTPEQSAQEEQQVNETSPELENVEKETETEPADEEEAAKEEVESPDVQTEGDTTIDTSQNTNKDTRSEGRDITEHLNTNKFFTLLKLTNTTKNHTIFEYKNGVLEDNSVIANDVNDNLNYYLGFASDVQDKDVIQEGDYALVPLPSALKWPTGAESNKEIMDGTREKICDFSIVTKSDGTQYMKFVFTKYISEHDNITGYVDMGLNFNRDKVDEENKTDFEWNFSGIAIDKDLIVNKGNATLSKEVSKWDASNKKMSWKLTIDSTGAESDAGYYIEDVLSEGQYLKNDGGGYAPLVMGETNIPYAPTGDTSSIPCYHYIEGGEGEKNKIIIYPGALKNRKVEINYSTFVDESWMLSEGFDGGAGGKVDISNEATFYSGSKVKIDSVTETYNYNFGMINKECTYTGSAVTPLDDTIKWRILVNNSGFDLKDVVVVDSIPDDMFVNQEIINAKVGSRDIPAGGSGSATPYYEVVGNDPANDKNKIVKFHLGAIKESTNLIFETKYSNDIFKEGNTEGRTNKAHLEGKDNSGKDLEWYYHEVTIKVSATDLQKSVVASNQFTGEVTWRVVLNTAGNANAYYNLQKLTLVDEITNKMKLVSGSVKYYSTKSGSTAYEVPSGQTASYTDAAGNSWEYDENSNPYDGGTFTLNLDPSYLNTEVSTGTDGYAFVLEYKTQCDPASFMLDAKDPAFLGSRKNVITMTSVDAAGEKTVDANAEVQMTGLEMQKTGRFDENANFVLPADEKFIHWNITGNVSRKDIKSPAFKDPIPEGLKYKEGSVKVGYRANIWSDFIALDSKAYQLIYDPDEGANGTLTVVIDEKKIPNYGQYIGGIYQYFQYSIEFDTTFSKPEKDLLTQGNVDFTNTAYLTHTGISEYQNGLPPTIESGKWLQQDSKVTINNVIADKSANYDPENPGIIPWYVDINDQGLGLKNVYFDDPLQPGLSLDMSEGAIEVYKLRYNKDTGVLVDDTKLPEKDVNNQLNYSVSFDYATNTFHFQFEGPLKDEGMNGAYRVYFKTFVDKAGLGSETTIQNKVTFNGGGAEIDSNSEAVELNMAGIDAGGSGDFASFSVYKYEKDGNNRKPLAGAVFELYDKNKDLITTLDATDADGTATYNKLRYNTQYYIREVIAPEGYVLDD